ncbi:MAG: ACT domain-containing protein, partial [Hydrogenovibrio sp.]
WVIGSETTEPSGEDKTAMVLAMPNKAGSLLEVLSSFAKRNISMTRIISIPSTETKWDYLFFIDVQGHQKETPLAEAIEEVRQKTSFCKILGSFPVSPLS